MSRPKVANDRPCAVARQHRLPRDASFEHTNSRGIRVAAEGQDTFVIGQASGTTIKFGDVRNHREHIVKQGNTRALLLDEQGTVIGKRKRSQGKRSRARRNRDREMRQEDVDMALAWGWGRIDDDHEERRKVSIDFPDYFLPT